MERGQNFIFSRSDRRPFDPSFLREKVLYPALRKAEIEPGDRTHGFHLFRHSAASAILAELTHDPMYGPPGTLFITQGCGHGRLCSH